MADFYQGSLITTLHDLGRSEQLEAMLMRVTKVSKIGLILPVTASDMRAPAFGRIMQELAGVEFLEHVVVVLGVTEGSEDYHQTYEKIAPLGSLARILWTDSPRVKELYRQLGEAGFDLGVPGKGRSVWTAFGYLLADRTLHSFVLHDCDIVNYNRAMLARLCLPMVHPSLDFDFCKAYYARVTDRMHGRVVRLLVAPLLSSLINVFGHDPFLEYMSSFRYPLSGEFAVSSQLARSNRVASDWGLEVGTLAEVFRNSSAKRVCQVDLCSHYEHKHQDLSIEDRNKGLMKMATDILMSIFRTLASRGTVFQSGHFHTLRSAFLREAQDAIRKYHADALINGLHFDRHTEELAVEGFAEQITAAGDRFQEDPSGGEAIPNWTRVLAALPDFPSRLRNAAEEDAKEFAAP